MAVNTFGGETLSDTELLDKIYDSNRMKLSKGVRKYRRGLKEQARKILGLTNVEINEIFNIKLKENKNIDVDTIKFNKIKSHGEVYEGEPDDYQMEVIENMFNFDWGEKLEIKGDKETDNPTHVYLKLDIKDEEDKFYTQLNLSNTHVGLEYLGDDIPKKSTELFIISKILSNYLKKIIGRIQSTIKYHENIVDIIIGNRNIAGRKIMAYSNEDIYNIINEKAGIKGSFDSGFRDVSNYINFIIYISEILKKKYPEFQIPIEYNKDEFDIEDYKKGLLFDAIEKIRKEYN